MNHAEMLRAAYAIFAQGDLDGYLAYCTPDIVFTVPGRATVSGIYDRAAFKSEMIAAVMAISNGTFQEDVLDVFTSDRGGVVYAEHRFTRDGRAYCYRTTHLYEIRDGKLTSFRELPEDLHAFEAAWGTA